MGCSVARVAHCNVALLTNVYTDKATSGKIIRSKSADFLVALHNDGFRRY